MEVLTMIHSPYRSNVQEYLDSMDIENYITSCSISYIKSNKIADCNDFDVFLEMSFDDYSSDFEHDLDELAMQVSINENKKVTVGYLSFIPIEERENKLPKLFIIKCFENGEVSYYESTALSDKETKEKMFKTQIDQILEVHSQFEKNKTLGYKNKKIMN